MFYPRLNTHSRTRQITDRFLGLDRRINSTGGSFAAMENMSSSHFPAASPRNPRGLVGEYDDPQGLLGKEQLVMVQGNQVLVGGLPVPGLEVSTQEHLRPKVLVSMGAWVVIFPDRLYVNTADLSDCGSLDNVRSLSCTGDAGISYSLCASDGTPYAQVLLSPNCPESPAAGELWMDTSASPHVLKVYSTDMGLWSAVASTCVRLEGAGIGAGFSPGDGVDLTGCSLDSLNGSAIVQDCGENFLVIPGLIDEAFHQNWGEVTVSRVAPDLDFVTECGNRLWGCKYGMVQGQMVNAIYACALGDFKNWGKFQGLATDSYRADRGSDGPWTGAISHLGCPLFFKEHTLEKVFPSATGAHEILSTPCRGVQKGSHKSLAIVGEYLYYKSPEAVCVYDGALPVSISDALGKPPYQKAVGGGHGEKYYLSLEEASGQSHLLVYDTGLGLWHREDELRVRDFAQVGQNFYALDDSGKLWSLDGGRGTLQEPVSWEIQTSPLGLDPTGDTHPDQIALSLHLEAGSHMDVFISYDGESARHHLTHLQGSGWGRQLVSLYPRRCSSFVLTLSGRGPCRLRSLSITCGEGSEALWP